MRRVLGSVARPGDNTAGLGGAGVTLTVASFVFVGAGGGGGGSDGAVPFIFICFLFFFRCRVMSATGFSPFVQNGYYAAGSWGAGAGARGFQKSGLNAQSNSGSGGGGSSGFGSVSGSPGGKGGSGVVVIAYNFTVTCVEGAYCPCLNMSCAIVCPERAVWYKTVILRDPTGRLFHVGTSVLQSVK